MNVPPEIQFLRCLANYEALRFSSPILTFARSLVSQMIEKSSRDNGKYVSVHLRFEEVLMLFSHLLDELFIHASFDNDFISRI